MPAQSLVYRKWFKCLIVLIQFIPVFTDIPFDSRYTVNVIAEVLKHPFIVGISWLLPITKFLLGIAAVSPFLFRNGAEKILLGYYACILIPVSVFQNMAYTEYGFTFVLGSCLVQLIVCLNVCRDVFHKKSRIRSDNPDQSYLWIIPLMILAFLMPYTVRDTRIVPSLRYVITNEAGVTYCMITPVILGEMILFHKDMYKPTLHLASFIGFSFGILNMMTWFGYQYQNWWMGILHLPLFIISYLGMKISR